MYLLNHAGKAGTERYVHSLIEKLNNKKIKAYFAYNEEGLLVDRLKGMGVETFRINMRGPFDIRAVRQLNQLCRRFGIELIHTQFLRENYIAILSRLFNPKVRVMYTNHFVIPNNPVQRAFNRILTPFESNIIAVCNKGKERLIANGNKASIIQVIFNGIDPYYWGESIKSTVRDELGISQDEFVMLCASRFAHDKGHTYLVNSISELKKMTNKKFKCVLAGDGPLLDKIKGQVQVLGLGENVIFTGFRSDMKNLFYGSDIYINASEHEALSFLIIEAMASGLPVVATNMGGNADIVNPQTNCGIMVEYNNATDTAKAILKLMEDKNLREEFSKNALKAVEEIFNLEKVAEKTYNLYVNSITNGREE